MLEPYSFDSYIAGSYQISGSEHSYLVEFYLGHLQNDKGGMYFHNSSPQYNQFSSSSIKTKSKFAVMLCTQKRMCCFTNNNKCISLRKNILLTCILSSVFTDRLIKLLIVCVDCSGTRVP